MAATEVVPALEADGSTLHLIVFAEENMDAADVKKDATHLENVGI